MEKISAVIFDMDGLMFDTETLHYKACQNAADRLGLAFSYEYYAKYIGMSDEEFHKDLYLNFENEEKVAAFISESDKYVMELVEKEGLTLKPGLVELLDYLEEEGIHKIVASSSIKSVVSFFLEKEKLNSYFDSFIGGDDVNYAKPHPEIFEKAWGKLGVPKERTLVLEDSPNGVRAAHRAGIHVIMIPDLIEPDQETLSKTLAVCNNLNEVITFIEQKNNQ